MRTHRLTRNHAALALIILTVMLALGCSKRYVITTALEQSAQPASTWDVGEIADRLPENFDPSKKPTIEHITSFKHKLLAELTKQKGEVAPATWDSTHPCQIQGSILDYKKGNGFLRFLFGSWAGAAKVVVDLKVVRLADSTTVFAGNFTGTVTDWASSGDKMWDNVAKDFAKAIVKERKRILAEAENPD